MNDLAVALSVGCPCGIGPEVALAAARDVRDAGRIVLVGDPGALADAARTLGIDLASLPHVTVLAASDLAPEARVPGKPTPEAGRAQLDAIDRATDEVLAGRAGALVTGPVSKHAITSAGIPFVGHTEHLQHRTNVPRVVMLFAGPHLRTSLVTTHLPLARVPAAITPEAVARTVVITARGIARDFGVARPRVVVAGLNPHAGEGGMFGTEDRDAIAPGCAQAAQELGDEAHVVGPVPAETAFRKARDGAWDVVVAMYHDQATIASKLVDFGDAVNVTLGLPIVRTSVDHGTGYDIAGKGTADAAGMRAALRLGFEMAARRVAK